MASNAEPVVVMGIEITPDSEAAMDIDVLDIMDDIADGQIYKMKKMLTALVGNDAKRVFDGLRGENGRVSLDTAMQFIDEYFEAVGLKN